MQILKVAQNQKLGTAASWSRPVGPTCPTDCPFLRGQLHDGTPISSRHRCYASKDKCAIENVKAAWAKNFVLDSARLRLELQIAHQKGIPVRIHAGGDFGDPRGSDAIDRRYLAALLAAARWAHHNGGLPLMWLYTHHWERLAKHRRFLARLGIQVFASVHSAKEATQAIFLGYRLAWDSGVAHADTPTLPLGNLRVMVCPAQRTETTCAKCRFCFRPSTGHVAFLRH